MSQIIRLQPRDAVFVDGMRITFDRINEAFIGGQLKYNEMSLLFKKFPAFHTWFIQKHRQVWV